MILSVRMLESLAVGFGDLLLLSLLLDGLGIRSARVRLSCTCLALLHAWAALFWGCPLAPFFLELRHDAQARWPALLERADPWIALAWAAGAAALLAAWGLRAWRVRASLASLARVEPARAEGLRRKVGELARDLGVEAPRVLGIEGASGSPFVTGLRHPTLVFPLALLDRLDGAEVGAVLSHELAHVRHRDTLGFALLELASRLMFWNPACALLARRCKEEVERCRDEECSGDIGVRTALARGLVKVYEASLDQAPAGACAFAARATERRLAHLSGAGAVGRARRVLAGSVLLLLMAMGSPARAITVAPFPGGASSPDPGFHSRLLLGLAWRT